MRNLNAPSVVTGCIFVAVTTEIHIQLLSSDVAFLKEKDLKLSDDTSHVIVKLGTDHYLETIATTRQDLAGIDSREQEVTPVEELKTIEALLQSLEIDLHSFRQILHRLGPRRDLFNPAGQILRALFGTVAISDITSLHLVTDKLRQQRDAAHSITDQVTYIGDIDKNARLNQETIHNLLLLLRTI
jgi:hypothetical protein